MAQRTDWGLVALLCGSSVLAAAQVGKVPPLLPGLRAEFGLGLLDASWLLSLFTLIAACTGFLAGRVAERVGPKRAMPWGLGLLALGGLLGAAAPGYGWLLASRVLEGCGLLAIVVSGPGLVRRNAAPQDQAQGFAYWSASTPAGVTIAMALAPVIGLLGWRAVWLVGAVLALLYLVPLRRALARAEPPPPSGFRRPDLATIGIGACFACYTMTWYTVVGFMPTLMLERLHWPAAIIGPASALVVAVNVGGNLVGGQLRARGLIKRWQAAVAGAVGLAVFGLGVFSPLPPLLAFACALLFSAVGGMLPAQILEAAAQLGVQRGLGAAAPGVVMQFSNIGQLVGPVILGATVEAAGWGAATLPVLLGSLGSLALAFSMRRLEQPASG